jgi:hypothetical protein
MRASAILPILFFAFLSVPVTGAETPPYPAGTSTQTHEGMEFTLVLPPDLDPDRSYALLIALHGMNGRGSNVAAGFASLAREGFVICGPQSGGPGWDPPNVKRAKAVLSHLIDVLPIDEKRLHGAAYSQACPFLASIVFDKRYHFVSASWGMGGSAGGKVPRHARKEMGAIALVGERDWARGAAEGTVSQLRKKVRNVECHVQRGLGHEFTVKLVPYHHFWLKVMNGAFVPGECSPFYTWTTDLGAARATMAREKRGGLVYVWSDDEREAEETRRFQNEVLFDPLVMHFGRQAVAVRLSRNGHADRLEALGVKQTPAIVVLRPDGTPAKVLEGARIKASTLAKALRGVAPEKRMPEEPGIHMHD